MFQSHHEMKDKALPMWLWLSVLIVAIARQPGYTSASNRLDLRRRDQPWRGNPTVRQPNAGGRWTGRD